MSTDWIEAAAKKVLLATGNYTQFTDDVMLRAIGDAIRQHAPPFPFSLPTKPQAVQEETSVDRSFREVEEEYKAYAAATSLDIDAEPECATCGMIVNVADDRTWNDGDSCWECTIKNIKTELTTSHALLQLAADRLRYLGGDQELREKIEQHLKGESK